ncbi:hypothetical protein DPEC_G00211620 [Dallia pectoralis]|uniref:Uncharacterized protein n=1 Tax=Dallia pectoralis TaxID=75939 RepID=A0ACC2G5Y6_DALPE|nr:hypothetical protein DPEC_G00211620 [Dallia pectoralis]
MASDPGLVALFLWTISTQALGITGNNHNNEATPGNLVKRSLGRISISVVLSDQRTEIVRQCVIPPPRRGSLTPRWGRVAVRDDGRFWIREAKDEA